MADFEQEQGGSPGADPEVAESEQYLEDIVAESPGGAEAAVASAEGGATGEPGRPSAAADRTAHFSQRFQQRRATEQALQTAQRDRAEMQQRLDALQRQIAQGPTPPPKDADPAPDFRTDPQGWYLWRDRQMAKEITAATDQRLAPIYGYLAQQMRQGQAQQQQVQQTAVQQYEASRVSSLENDYEREVPAYRQVMTSAIDNLTGAYLQHGYTPQQAVQLAGRDLHAVWLRGEAMGRHPAEFLHSFLTYSGSQTGGGAPAPVLPPSGAQRRVSQMQAAARAPEAGSLSQSAGSGAAAPAGAARLTRNGKGAASARDLHAAVNRREVDVDDIYRTAYEQEAKGL